MPEPRWPRRGASIADDRLESLASLAEIDHQEARERADAALRAIRPLDATEADHRADALA
jgi:hypothetical protein